MIWTLPPCHQMRIALFGPDAIFQSGRMGLLLSCRQVYAEAVQFLYSSNIYSVYGRWSFWSEPSHHVVGRRPDRSAPLSIYNPFARAPVAFPPNSYQRGSNDDARHRRLSQVPDHTAKTLPRARKGDDGWYLSR